MNEFNRSLDDLQSVCVHEQAHYVVALHFGIHGHVRLEENPVGGQFEKYWTGRFFMTHVTCNGGSTAGRGVDEKRDDRALRLVALAGALAVEMRHPRDPITSADDAWDALVYGGVELSESDADLAGDFTFEDVVECLRLLALYATEIDQEARWLFDSHKPENPPPKAETPELAATESLEHIASVAAFDNNHGADRGTSFSFAQAPAAAVVRGVQQ